MVFRTFSENAGIGFSITDTGIGVTPDQIDGIFEYGISSKGSSGFGLYYCRMFVEANGGKLTLTSPGPGDGATVTAWFPSDGGRLYTESPISKKTASDRASQAQ